MSRQEEIINGCKKYNVHYQKALYTLYAPAMLSLCLRYSSNKEEAKDLLQEGFIKIYDKITSYKNEGSFEGWMKRIMVNTAIDQIRKNKKNSFVNIDSIPESTHLEGEEENQLDEIKNDYTYEELVGAINSLNDEFKIVFNMFVIENYSHREIAELLSIKEETSRSRLIRAKSKIKGFLLKTKQGDPSYVKK